MSRDRKASAAAESWRGGRARQNLAAISGTKHLKTRDPRLAHGLQNCAA